MGRSAPSSSAAIRKVKFLGEKKGQDLTSHLAAADVFVFPSLTDTFGVVQLEALACGTPVAAFPVTGPLDVIADHPIGALGRGSAKRLPRARSACRARRAGILRSSVPGKTVRRQFIGNLDRVAAEPFAATRPPRRGQNRGTRLIESSSQQQ